MKTKESEVKIYCPCHFTTSPYTIDTHWPRWHEYVPRRPPSELQLLASQQDCTWLVDKNDSLDTFGSIDFIKLTIHATSTWFEFGVDVQALQVSSETYKAAENPNIPRKSLQLLEFDKQLSRLDIVPVLDASDWKAAFFDPTEMLGLLPSERRPEKDVSHCCQGMEGGLLEGHCCHKFAGSSSTHYPQRHWCMHIDRRRCRPKISQWVPWR